MMGGQSSKSKGSSSSSTPPSPAVKPNTPSPSAKAKAKTKTQYAEEFSSYEDACRSDPGLQSFDTNLHQRTNHVISTLATGVDMRSMSLGSFKEVATCLLEMNQDVVKVILDFKTDIWNNKDLSDVVEEYFKSSIKLMEFCAALENSVKRARRSQLIIQVAVNKFEEEVEMQDGVAEKKFGRTLEELEKFKAAGDPFTKEFFALFQLVYAQQVSLLKTLQRQKKKLDKKLKNMKSWRRISNVLFVSTFVAVLIFSVVAAAIAAPPIITALAGALSVPIGSVGKWIDTIWSKYLKEVKGQKEILSSIQIGTFITIQDMDNVRLLVNKMELQIEAMLQAADIALGDEDTLKLVIGEIKKKMEVFVETIEDLGEHADKCNRDISRARTLVLEKIIKYPGR